MTRNLVIKKEVRTLGLDLCNPRRMIGAVVRGGYYLDGVVAFPRTPSPESKSIASLILRTRFYPELRLIMVHNSPFRFDAKLVENKTNLPVIEVASARKRNSNQFKS